MIGEFGPLKDLCVLGQSLTYCLKTEGDKFEGAFVWHLEVPKIVKVFLWLLMHGRLKTHCRLQKQMPFLGLSQSWCILCKISEENMWHLFFNCLFAVKC